MTLLQEIKDFFVRPNYEWVDHLIVDGVDGEWYICFPDGEKYAGPYRRAQDAKGQLTRMRNEYTPAARRPTKTETA